jgi:hypothetical protein
MILTKSFIHILLFLFISIFLGCMKDSTKSSSAPNAPEVVNRLIGNNYSPADFPSKSQSLITLSYTSLDNDIATGCSISQISNVTITQACSCDGVGVCVVGATGNIGYVGAGSFAFNISAGSKTSTTGRASFNITAPPPGSNIQPTISAIAAKSTNEGVTINFISFTVADADSVVNCSNVTAASSNTTLVPVANIYISGTSTCYVSIVPTANKYGSSNIVLTLTDNGSPLPVKTATSSFTLTVNGFNDPPTISSIAAQTLTEDTASAALPLTITDSDSTLNCSNVTPVSSNSTLISNSNVVIGGTAPNCTVTITPNLNQSGSSNITLTLTDNGLPLPAKSVVTTFAVTVGAVNDPPVISTITTQTTNQNVAKSVAFTISDLESTVTCAGSVGITSSNTTMVPNSNIVVTGTAPNCSALITPANNEWGTTNLTILLTDSGTPMPAETSTKTFAFNVSQANIAPTISAITAKTTNEDTATSAITFTIADTDSIIFCTNVAGTSSNTTLIPNGNIVIAGTAPNCTVTITPVANLSGTSTITLTLTDNGSPMPALTATSTFLLTVNPINDAPTISAITSKSTDEDVASAAITFTIADIDSTITCAGSVSAVSSNTTVIPNANVVISGSAPNCQAIITSAANKNGSATITLTVTDNGTPVPALTATSAFTMTIDAVPDITGSLTVANNLSGVASSYSGNSYARKLSFSGLTSDEALTSLEVCLGTTSGGCDVSSWVVGTGYTTSGSAPTVTIAGSYKMKSGVGGAQSFTLAASCSSTTNYYYSVRGTNSISNLSNVVSTPAWNFWEPTCLGASILTQWLDASEPATITVSSGVSLWKDKSGNNRDVTQATASDQPGYSATSLLGLPGITFDGANTTLMRNAFVYAQGTSSIFTVLTGPVGTTTRYLVSEGASGSNYYSPLATSSSDNVTMRVVNDSNTSVVNIPATSTILFDGLNIHLAMTQDTGTTFNTYSDGVKQTQADFTYSRASFTTPATFKIGARYRTGVDSSWFSGTMGEFMVTYGILTTLQRQKLEGYSAHKWGVNGNLLVAHPYSVSPP